MSNTNLTPKGWRVVKRGNQTGLRMLAVDTNTQQGGSWEPKNVTVLTEQNLANAYLIAAAPDLYEALRLAMPALKHLRTQFPRHPDDDSIDVLKLALVAISKAEGKE
jgi:hypothetical protein